MSVRIMGAVFDCGPRDQTAAFVLLAIADNADDFGFACPSRDTIALKARCDEKTVGRHIDQMEREGWLGVVRKLINGKGNAYFINLSKIGVTVSPESKRSPLHTSLRKRIGDNLTPIFVPKKSEDMNGFSTDNPQPPQRTFEGGSEDIFADSEGTRCPPNHEPLFMEPSGESPADLNLEPLPRSGVTNTPVETLSEANPEQLRRWDIFRTVLKEDLCAAPAAVAKRFSEVRPGVNDFDACFRDWWLVRFSFSPGPIEFITEAADVAATQAGVDKYHDRLVRRASLFFPIVKGDRVKFTVRQTAARELERAS